MGLWMPKAVAQAVRALKTKGVESISDDHIIVVPTGDRVQIRYDEEQDPLVLEARPAALPPSEEGT